MATTTKKQPLFWDEDKCVFVDAEGNEVSLDDVINCPERFSDVSKVCLTAPDNVTVTDGIPRPTDRKLVRQGKCVLVTCYDETGDPALTVETSVNILDGAIVKAADWVQVECPGKLIPIGMVCIAASGKKVEEKSA